MFYTIGRMLRLRDPDKPSSYRHFKGKPIVDVPTIAYRGDGTEPRVVRNRGGFRSGGVTEVTAYGLSTNMVSLTREPEVGATYYAFQNRALRLPDPAHGYVYVVFVPSGMAVDAWEVARREGTRQVRSSELAPLRVPWRHVIGWRQLPAANLCRPSGADVTRQVTFSEPYRENPDCNNVYISRFATLAERRRLHQFKTSGTIEVRRSGAVM